MKTVTIECRRIDEWDEDTRKRLINSHRDINVDYGWWDSVYEDFRRICACLGVEPRDINFRGFWSQGDGARFNGHYDWKPDAPTQIREYAPQDTELHRIADELAKFPEISAAIEYRGAIYEHEYMTEITVNGFGHYDEYETIAILLRDLMRWLYRQLEREYEYLVSDEAVYDTLHANEYEFDVAGRIW